MTYIPGDYWMVCERTGIKFRRSEMRPEPVLDQDGYLWVHHSVLNPPHPQDFVRTPAEDPSVYPANSAAPQSLGESVLGDSISKYAKEVYITASSGVAQYDAFGVRLDDGTVFWNFAASVDTLTGEPLRDSNGIILRDVNGEVLQAAGSGGLLVTLNDGIPYAASSGNAAYLPGRNNEEWQ